jgi:uncharacterized membrane protein SpoIIM required for sporulation
MVELVLKSQRFRAEREADWRKLEALIVRIEKRSAGSLTDEEMIALPALYRSALSSLSVARAISLDQAVIAYLEGLCLRAYFCVYGQRSRLSERVARFFSHDWPAAARSLWRETIASALVSVIGAVVAYILVSGDPDWYYSFIPDALSGGRTPAASTEFLRNGLFEGGESEGLSVFAAFLFTHNAQIAILAFALGFAFCLPTALLLAYNGCILGAFFALYVSRGLGVELGGWLLIHGVTELFAVTLAGAAGMRIGWALAFPGKETRLEAARAAGAQAATLLAGVVVMLFVAGLLEGFSRQLITDTTVRYVIAAASGLVWLAYLYFPRGPSLRGARHGAG